MMTAFSRGVVISAETKIAPPISLGRESVGFLFLVVKHSDRNVIQEASAEEVRTWRDVRGVLDLWFSPLPSNANCGIFEFSRCPARSKP